MKVINEPIPGCFHLEPTVFGDHRGYFFESFNDALFEKLTGANSHFVQDNQSLSSKGVMRGLHFQIGDAAQAKLVRVIKGAVWDVAVDLRPGSSTYGQWFGVELNEENKQLLYVPRGFAHGFVTLEDDTIFAYKCDNHYSKADERGVIYNDPDLNIQWPTMDVEPMLSEKDLILPTLAEAQKEWMP